MVSILISTSDTLISLNWIAVSPKLPNIWYFRKPCFIFYGNANKLKFNAQNELLASHCRVTKVELKLYWTKSYPLLILQRSNMFWFAPGALLS